MVGACLVAQTTYLPQEAVPKFNKEAAEFFIQKAGNSDEKMTIFCIEKAIQFLQDKDHLELMANWILKESENVKGYFKLTSAQKYSVLKTYHACPEFSVDQKKALKEAVIKDDKTDEGQVVAKACDMLLPDAELKEKLWTEICDPETKEPLKELTQKVMCFF